jgi:ribosomal protein S18 acetylase RimI-like enzyme
VRWSPSSPSRLVDPELRAEGEIAQVINTNSAPMVAEILASSHHHYPAFVAMFPNDRQRHDVLTALMKQSAADTIRSACCLVSPGHAPRAAALWFPPGTWPPSIGRQIRMAAGLVGLARTANTRFPMLMRVGMALQSDANGRDGWYLQALGVQPEAQRQGHGGRLLRAVLEHADASQQSCWLHTSDPANFAYYARFGFHLGHPLAPVVDGGPGYATMIRPPCPTARTSQGPGGGSKC